MIFLLGLIPKSYCDQQCVGIFPHSVKITDTKALFINDFVVRQLETLNIMALNKIQRLI